MSIEALGAALSGVREQLVTAYAALEAASGRIEDAEGTLAELSRGHSESLVPPQFRRAGEQLQAGRELLAAAIEATDRYAGLL